jgi:hypothetical protein
MNPAKRDAGDRIPTRHPAQFIAIAFVEALNPPDATLSTSSTLAPSTAGRCLQHRGAAELEDESVREQHSSPDQCGLTTTGTRQREPGIH